MKNKPPRRLLVIHNPTAGRRKRRILESVLGHLEGHGSSVSLRATARRGDAERFAAEAVGMGVDAVIIAGGDGTINEVINGVLRRKECEPPHLGLIPLGTANVLAADLDLPRDAAGLSKVLVQGATQPAYVGCANDRFFVMMAGVGLDAEVVEHVDVRLKRAVGKAAYVWQTLVEWSRQDARCFQVEIDGVEVAASAAVIANGRHYAGPFVLAPRARLGDPLFHVCLYRRIGRWPAAKLMVAVVLGKTARLEGFEVRTARVVRVSNTGADPVQGDGEVIARLPVTVFMHSRPVRFLAP